MPIHRQALRLLLVALAALAVNGRAVAVEVLPGLEIHGYGDAGFVREAVSPQARTTNDHDISLLGTYKVYEGGRAWVQLAHLGATDRLRADLLFFDADIDVQTTVRIGQARLPTGIYNETRDVQSLRASASLPLLYAGDPVAIDKALRGVTIDHRFGATPLGEFEAEAFVAWGLVPDGDAAEAARLTGGRLSWLTPISGLTLKLSAYTGHLRDAVATNPRPLEQAFVGSARYETGPWMLTAEAANSRADGHAYSASYVELVRQLAPAWRGFVRAESVHDRSVDEDGEGPRRHSRLALGVAWDASHWGLRLEAGRNNGRLAETPTEVDPETLRRRWTDLRISANYIF